MRIHASQFESSRTGSREPGTKTPAPGSHQRGYALLFVLFLVALVIIGAAAAILSPLAEGRRQREEDLIWRGQQYDRAIGLYFRKFGKYPSSLDDLIKPTNGVRFLRQEYKDPMNTADGSWRLIYVAPGGQLIGSVRFTSLQEMAAVLRSGGKTPGSASQTPSGSDENSGENGNNLSNGPGQNPSGGQANSPIGGPQPVPAGGATSPFGLQSSVGTGDVFGGAIVGVASKIDKPSLKVFEDGTTYKQWEFIYNPLLQFTITTQPAIRGQTQPPNEPPGAVVPPNFAPPQQAPPPPQ